MSRMSLAFGILVLLTLSGALVSQAAEPVRWEVAEGSGWTIEPAVMKVAVPPLEARSYSFTLTRQAGAAGPPPVFSFVAGDEELRVRRGPLRVQEPQ